jgi:alpha-L-fucosidase
MDTKMRTLILLGICMIASIIDANAQKQTNARAQWFVDARFGMFIHWGVYSAAEGIWKGEKHRDDNDYAEWIYYRNRISEDEYLTLLDRFQWDEIDPEEWVVLAKRSGMKYVTITAKHHDGFALWDSKIGAYDVGDHTNPKRDIIGELAAACRKHGLKLGLYYSHWVDWAHPYGWDHTKELTGIDADLYDRYWQEKVMPQVRELLTNYGEIGLMWFDMWIHHSEAVVTKEQLLQLKNMIRELQPDCLVNSRLGLSVEEDSDVDFQTLGDNQLGTTKKDFPWQSPGTVAHSWGYHALDTEWKSTTTLLKALINNVSLNGNYMLNIGPRANGDVPYEISSRMIEMGRWLATNGASVYTSGAFDLEKDMHDWGLITCSEEEKTFRLFLHVYNWPLSRQLPLTGIKQPPSKAYLLADKLQSPLTVRHNGLLTTIDLPQMAPDEYISVIVLEYNERPQPVRELVARQTYGGYSMTADNVCDVSRALDVIRKSRRGTVPEHVLVRTATTFKWKIYVDTPGSRRVDISYSYQNDKPGGQAQLLVDGAVLDHQFEPTGKTVGEPNQNWVIDNFASQAMGEVRLDEGVHEIELKIEPAGKVPVQFQWLWLE